MHPKADTVRDFRKEFLWRFSKYMLDDRDITWAGEHLSELCRMSVEPMFPLLLYVWNDLLVNTQRLAQVYPILTPLGEALEYYCQSHRRTLINTLDAQQELLHALAQADIWPLIIKGAAMPAYTSTPQAMNDLDVMARDLDEAWQVIRIAEELGYGLTRLKLCQSGPGVESSVRYYGHSDLYRREGGGTYIQGDWDLGRVRTLDLHIAHYHAPGEGILLTDLWLRSWRAQLGTTEALIPSLEDMILLELIHLLRHGTLAIRGLNHIAQLLSGPMLNRDYLFEEIRHNDLSLIASAVFLAIEQTFSHLQEQASELRSQLGKIPLWSRPFVAYLATLRRVERYGTSDLRSLCIQANYLYHSYRRQAGYRWPLFRSLIGFQQMFRNRQVYPHAYVRWQERKYGWLSPRNRSVMLVRLDNMPWQTAKVEQTLQQQPQLAAKNIRVSQTSLFIDSGQTTEALLTPIGSFTTANYVGRVPEREAHTCLERLEALRQTLK